MDWKEKLKWKFLIILIALIGILIVWCAGEKGKRKGDAEIEILKAYMIKENERESVRNVPEKTVESSREPVSAEEYKEGPKIRVLLMTDGYEGYYHDTVRIQFQGDYQMQGAKTQKYASKETLEVNAGSLQLTEGSVTLYPENENNRLLVLSLHRGQGSPAYRGSLTLHIDEKGIRIVNELPLEQYLMGVVPSEMPASYPMEALKAQAVCARTYACSQMQNSSLADLGAQVDDSVAFQVYENSGEAETSTAAVLETAGEILLNQGIPINAYYFSTSHGKTSTDQVWEASVPASYLKSVLCTYDREEPWYRWSVVLSKEKLQENVKQMFPGVSQVEDLEIREKGEGDAVLTLAVQTDQGEKELHSEYDIRTLLAPLGVEISRQDGSVVKGGSLLPSAYFTLEEQRDNKGNLAGYLIRGGGSGHGVGMSQNGAKGMANKGKSYEEILSYFYKDVELGDGNDIVKFLDS